MTEVYSNMSHYHEQEQRQIKLMKAHLDKVQTQQKTYDDVQNPRHYTMGVTIEPIDYIIDHELDFLEGNIVKYVTRYTMKAGVKDLEKAKFYLEKLIEREKAKEDTITSNID